MSSLWCKKEQRDLVKGVFKRGAQQAPQQAQPPADRRPPRPPTCIGPLEARAGVGCGVGVAWVCHVGAGGHCSIGEGGDEQRSDVQQGLVRGGCRDAAGVWGDGTLASKSMVEAEGELGWGGMGCCCWNGPLASSGASGGGGLYHHARARPPGRPAGLGGAHLRRHQPQRPARGPSAAPLPSNHPLPLG